MTKDELYKQPLQNIEDFSFDETVSRVFDDMVERSVPGYRTLIANIGPIASYFIRANTNCYDLGCSHGATALSIFRATDQHDFVIHAIDNAPAMIRHCRRVIEQQQASAVIHTQLAAIEDVLIHNASVVVLNLTLQFLAIDQRQQVLKNIYDGLIAGGVCILTEKNILNDLNNENLFQQLHATFKAANQYSQLEISQKIKALENVLVQEPLQAHQQRLAQAGFKNVVPWFQCINFVSLLAIK